MGRITLVIDDELIERVMRLYGFKTGRETVDYALRRLADAARRREEVLELEGIGWEGDLDEMRRTRFPEWSE